MHEAVVRAAVEARVHAEVARHGPTLVVHELGLCQAEARVDVAAVNGRLVGYEIKTRADTLARLRRQEKVYSRVFDRVWLVADDRHIAAATEMIPGWWGVMRITSKADTCLLTLVRPSRLNRDVDPRSLVRLLWRAEVMSELEVLGLADGLDREPRRVLWEELAGAVPRRLSLPELQKRVRSRLKSREGWRSDRLRKSDGGSS